MLLKERLNILLTQLDIERNSRREKMEPPIGMRWRHETVVVMKRNLLNYLCAAPLAHGMRSLNTLMWNLEATPGTPRDRYEHDPEGREQYTITLGDRETVARHVRQEGEYRDPQTLWARIKRQNGLDIDGDRCIRIILDGENVRLWNIASNVQEKLEPADIGW